MKKFRICMLTAAACAFSATSALAHAFLDHASPAVGSTASGSPRELELSFTQDIVPAFSGVSVASAEGGAVPTGKATVAGSRPNTLHVSLGRALKPGVYVVSWHVVSVDTHRTSGSFKFTVAP
jgi:methionine-rich copper-binding protein CopC